MYILKNQEFHLDQRLLLIIPREERIRDDKRYNKTTKFDQWK